MLERAAEWERTVLAAVLNNRTAFWSLAGYLEGGDFSTPKYRLAWESLRVGANVPDLPEVQGLPVDGDRVWEAAKKVKALANLRRVKTLCAKTKRILADGTGKEPEEVLSWFIQEAVSCGVSRFSEVMVPPERWTRVGQEEIERRMNGTRPSFDLGLGRLTEALSPEAGHLFILAGETGKGKTALALNLAAGLGITQGVPVLFVNTEMSLEELVLRLYALLGQFPLSRLRRGDLTEEEFGEVRRLAVEAASSKLWLTDSLPWATVEDVAGLARQAAAVFGMKVLVLDWVQRLEGSDPRKDGWKLLIEAARALKSLAQELGILVLAVCQLTEEGFLAESRGMAREADGVVHLEEAEPGGQASHVLHVKKARHAPSGTRIPVVMDRATLKFYEADPAAVAEPSEPERGKRRRVR